MPKKNDTKERGAPEWYTVHYNRPIFILQCRNYPNPQEQGGTWARICGERLAKKIARLLNGSRVKP